MADFHLVGNVFYDFAVMVVEVEQEVTRSADLQGTECDDLRLLCIFYGEAFALSDDILAQRQILAIECRLNPIHYIIYSAFAEQSDEQSCKETRQPASLSGFRDVAFATMFPLPNLCGNEESVEEEEQVMLQLFEPLLLGNLVKGEDVDIDALVHLDMLECGF